MVSLYVYVCSHVWECVRTGVSVHVPWPHFYGVCTLILLTSPDGRTDVIMTEYPSLSQPISNPDCREDKGPATLIALGRAWAQCRPKSQAVVVSQLTQGSIPDRGEPQLTGEASGQQRPPHGLQRPQSSPTLSECQPC